MRRFTSLNESTKKWKISLDFHGVIDSMPDFFSFFTKSLISCGCEIHIVTGGLNDNDLDLIKKYDIKYTKIFSIVDHHKNLGTPTYGKHPVHGFDMVSDEEWDKSKADYCSQQGIDLHIDDTIIYNGKFVTPFAQLFTNKRPLSNRDNFYSS